MFLAHEQDITERYFFLLQSSMVHAKINLYLNIPVYSLISPSNIKDKNKIKNNYSMPHAHICY